MADEKLNSLDRFRKRSDRLVLEHHSHCEVPAGCGGLVMRWRNPLVALPLLIRLYPSVATTLFIDGEPVTETGNDVVPGPHVFAILIDRADLSAGLFMLAAIHEQRGKQVPPGLAEPNWRLISQPDGSWLATTQKPIELAGKTWTDLAFGDSHWS